MRTFFSVLALVLVALGLSCDTGKTIEPTPTPPVATPARSASRPSPWPRALKSPPPPKPDTRTPDQIAQAACVGADGAWHCPKMMRKTVLASTGSSPIIPSSWTIGGWWIDPQNTTGCASNSNSGTSATCSAGGIGPLKTYQELNVHRWGCLGNPRACPRVRQNTIVTFLSSHTDDSDPVYAFPATENGAYFALAGGPPTVVSSAVPITVNAAKNHAAGSNSLLTVTYNASAAVAQLVQNNTHTSRAWVYKNVTGNEYTTTQPMALTSVGGGNQPSEVDTWATSDSVNLLQPVQVNIAAFDPIREDHSAYSNSGFVYQLTIYDPVGVGDSSVILGTGVNLYEVRSQRIITSSRFDADWFLDLTNCFDDGGVKVATTMDWYGGALPSSAIFTQVGGGNGSSGFDGDVIVGGMNYGHGQLSFGQVYIDGLINVAPGGDVVVEAGPYGGNFIYGSSAGNFEPDHATVRYHFGAGTAATYFTAPSLISPGFKLNFEPQTLGCVLISSGTTLTTAPSGNCNLAVTVANLDANLGATIGCLGVPNGAAVCNEL